MALTPDQIRQANSFAKTGGVTPTQSMTPEQAKASFAPSVSTSAPAASPVAPVIESAAATVLPGGNAAAQAIPKVVPAMKEIASNTADRADKTNEIIHSDSTLPSKALQVAGQASAEVNDTAGSVIKAVVPDGVLESIGSHLAPLVHAAAETPAGQSVLSWWKGLDTETQKNLSAGGQIASLLSNAIGVGAAKKGAEIVGDEAFQQGVKDTVAPVIDSVKDVANKVSENVKSSVTPNPDASFEKSLQKAYPMSKPEAKKFGAEGFNTDAKTVFKDIISNKETNGIVDDASGNVKEPKDYTFQDTLDAQDKRMPQIYKDYTSKLEGVDKEKFDTSITDTVVNTMGDLEKQIAKENSIPDQKAMQGLYDELGALRDTSPEGMQDYLQKLGQRARGAPGAALSQEQIQTANLAGKIKEGLDAAVENTGETGYAAGRALYKAHKTMQDAFIRGALKEARATPGLMNKLTTLGLTGEGIAFMLTHNPAALVTAAGIKGANSFIDYIKSPARALGNIYKYAPDTK